MGRGDKVRDERVIRDEVVADPFLAAAVEEAVTGPPLDAELELGPPRPLSRGPQDFSGLYMRYRYTIVRHASRYLHDRRDVDEVVQETFLKLFLALPDLEDEIQAVKFCRRVVTNLCIDRYRERVRHPMLLELEAEAEDGSADPDFDPVVAAEDAEVVREALALLSPLQRAALVMREVEEKTLPQIASELGIPADNVKHVLHRARQALRRILVGAAASGSGAGSAARGAAAGTSGRAGAVVVLLIVALVLLPRAFPSSSVPHARSDSGAPAAVAPAAQSGAAHSPAVIDPARSRSVPSASARGHRSGSGSHGSTPAGRPTSGQGSQTGSKGSGPTGSHGSGHTGGHHNSGGGKHHSGGGSHKTGGKGTGGNGGVASSGPVVCTACGALLTSVPVTGATQVTTDPPSTAKGVTTSISTFSAPTTAGTFGVSQVVTNQVEPDGTSASTATVQPTLEAGQGVQTFQVTSVSASVVDEPNGTVEVNATAQLALTSQTDQPQLESFTASFLYSSPSLTTIESEVVSAPMTVPTAPTSESSNGGSNARASAGQAQISRTAVMGSLVSERREVVA